MLLEGTGNVCLGCWHVGHVWVKNIHISTRLDGMGQTAVHPSNTYRRARLVRI